MMTPAPIYQRIKTYIIARITSGQLQTGARVPSENELADHFQISRMTANRALRELARDGYVKRIPGIGTFVREPTPQGSLLEIKDIAEEISARGHTHQARVIAAGFVAADAELARAFAGPPGMRLYHLRIVHMENTAPVQLETRFVNPDAVPDISRQDFSRQTTTAYLLSVVPVDELEHTVEAVLAEAEDASLLAIAADEPCLSLHRRSWSQARVVTVATLLYPASRYALRSRYRTTPSGTIDQRRDP